MIIQEAFLQQDRLIDQILLLSVVKLLRIDDNIIYVGGIDMIEGTPVLDIKPYIPEFESNEGIRIGWLEEKI